jgi:hypothetical protein
MMPGTSPLQPLMAVTLPRLPYFVARPQLLTCASPLPTGRDLSWTTCRLCSRSGSQRLSRRLCGAASPWSTAAVAEACQPEVPRCGSTTEGG